MTMTKISFSKTSRPALRLTHPPVMWVPGEGFCVGVKLSEREANHLQLVPVMYKNNHCALRGYHQFNIQQFYVPPTQCIYVFCVDLSTNSDYVPIQH